jgi:single-stranded-DNA-specific exonuclease
MRRTHQPKRWKILDGDIQAEALLQIELGVHPVMARLLVQRGLTTPEAADRFLNPSLDRMYDPFLLPDAEAACERLKTALAEKQKIWIHGDYDGDGVTSAALWTRCLRALGADVEVFVPHRRRDGYDMRMDFVEKARDADARLIVTTDCGIQRCDEVDKAREWGIDVIVTDHHAPNTDGELPKAVAVVNPHRSDSRYPFPDLAGVGVAFKLCEALTMHLGGSVAGFRRGFLDLAAVGTITDVVPLMDENRIIVRHGLQALRETKKPGLRALLDICGLKDRALDVNHVGFGIGPRLNAAGRIDETQFALDLLMTKDAEQAGSLARKLNELNAQRKEDQARAQEEAFAQVAQQDVADARCLVISGANWSSGIVGLVASKIVQRFHRPCIVIAVDETGRGKGSARSISAFNIIEAIDTCKDLLIEYGGHPRAAGLAIASEHLADFTQQMNRLAAAALSAEDCVATLEPAMDIDPNELTFDLLEQVQQLQPFGTGNPAPLFVSRSIPINSILTMGKEREHLKFILGVERPNPSGAVDAPWFYRGDMRESLEPCASLDICFKPDINEFNGRRSVQFIVEDVNAPEW